MVFFYNESKTQSDNDDDPPNVNLALSCSVGGRKKEVSPQR